MSADMSTRLEMFPKLEFLSESEKKEFEDLVEIVQSLSGVEWIASNSQVMFDPLCKPHCDRIRELLVKNMDLEEADSIENR